MTRKEALKALIADVEAGPGVELYHVEESFESSTDWDNAIEAFSGSLDAAKALHEAMLPGYEWHLGPLDAKIYPCDGTPAMARSYVAGNPARAWLLAILRALHSLEPKP